MEFKDYEDTVDPIHLPIGGKKYTLPPVGFGNALKITMALEKKTPLSNIELRDMILGPLVKQFETDQVPAEAVGRAFATGIALFQRGRDAAQAIWESGGDPNLTALYLKSVMPQASTPTDGASTTKTPASGTGTKTSRKKSAVQEPQSGDLNS